MVVNGQLIANEKWPLGRRLTVLNVCTRRLKVYSIVFFSRANIDLAANINKRAKTENKKTTAYINPCTTV